MYIRLNDSTFQENSSKVYSMYMQLREKQYCSKIQIMVLNQEESAEDDGVGFRPGKCIEGLHKELGPRSITFQDYCKY